LSYIHILYTQKGVYIIYEYKKNFEREAFRFSMGFFFGSRRSKMFPTGFIEVSSLGSEKLFLGVLTKNIFFFANYSTCVF